MTITGKVVYQNLGMGCWGIVANNGKEYRPINMPEQLKTKGAQVTVNARPVQESVSMFMWGTPVKITSFETIGS